MPICIRVKVVHQYMTKMLSLYTILPWLYVTAFLPLAFPQNFQIRWFRPRILGVPGQYTNFVNSPREFLLLHKRIYFDSCTYSGRTNDSASYQWTIFDPKKERFVLHDSNSTDCLHGWTAPVEGDYVLHVIKSHSDKSQAFASVQFFVKDIWLVTLGDSFASGQGDPDKWGYKKSQPAQWANTSCFRSTFSFPYLIYERILKVYPQHGVLFTFLACSDASVESGLLGPHEGLDAQVTDLLEKVVLTAKGYAARAPDLVLLTIGGNDIGFFDVATQVLVGVISVSTSFSRLHLPERFSNLTQSLHRLNVALVSYGIDPSDVFYLEYFDPMRDETGKVNSQCAGLFFATDTDLQIANDHFLIPLNELIKKQSEILGWNCVCNIADAFLTHGYCSKESYVRSVQDSLAMQGTGMGMFHPTYTGHQVVAEKVWPQIEKHLIKKVGER